MRFKTRLNAVLKNGFVRSAGALVGGTAAAQALTVLALPILTRLYSPEDFSLLAVYVAILTMLTAVTCLRLEIAIPLPEGDVEAANLLALALLFSTLTALISGVLVFIFGQDFFQAIGHQQIQPYGWLLPFGIWLAGCYAAVQYWSTRKKRFPSIAKTRMMQVGSGLTAQVGLGWAGSGSVGLMLGHALMSGAGVVSLARHAWHNERDVLRRISRLGMWSAFIRYRRFPQYSTFEALANNAAIQLPVIIIAALAIGPEAGFLLLATRAMGTPVTLVGGAVAQVYLARAPNELREGRLSEFTSEVLHGLAQFGVAPLVFIAMIAPSVFALVFGDEWRRAGELVAWMTPWFVLKLLSSPVSMVMHIKMMQRAMLGLMLIGLALRIVATLGAYAYDSDFIVEGYALSGMVFYLAAFLVYLRAAGLGWRFGVAIIRAAFLPTSLAVFFGVLFLEFIELRLFL